MYGIALADMVALFLLTFVLFRFYRHVRDYGLHISPRGSYDRPGGGNSGNASDPDNASYTDNSGACAGNGDGRVSKRFVGDCHGRR